MRAPDWAGRLHAAVITYPYERYLSGELTDQEKRTRKRLDPQHRLDLRLSTIDQLTAIDLPPFVAMSQVPPKQLHNRFNGLDALESTPQYSALLFCEDDILLGPDTVTWLELLIKHQVPAWLYVPGARRNHLHQGRMNQPPKGSNIWLADRGEPVRPGLIPVRGLESHYGTQCVFLPYSVVKVVMDHPAARSRSDNGMGPFDVFLRNILRSRGIVTYTPMPNPVQHLAPATLVRDRGRHKSRWYGLRTTRPVSELLGQPWQEITEV